MIGNRLRQKRARPSREDILKSVVALTRYVGRDHHAAHLVEQTQSSGKGVTRLFRYLLESSPSESSERVDAGGAFNLVGSNPEAWEAQLVAAADQCPARCDPLEHYVLSWPQGERPSGSQLEAAARTLMKELGFGKCPAVWAAHNDTDNLHLHVAVVRFDLETGKAAGLDWDIDALHQAIAIIEHKQGWKPEKDALFRIEGSIMREAKTGAPVRDLETGEFFPRNRKKGLDLSKAAMASQLTVGLYLIKDWERFHSEAANFGLRYVRKGSGAVVQSRTGTFKASAVSSLLSLKSLEARLGPFVGPRGKNGTTYEGYERSYTSCLDQIRASQAAAREHLDKVRKDERAKIAAILAAVEARALLLAFNQAIEREIAAARAALDEAYRKAKKDLLGCRLDRAAWEAAGEPAHIDPVPPPAVLFPTLTVSKSNVPDIEAAPVRHRPREQTLELTVDHRYESGRVAFTDHRSILIVHDNERTAVCAALQLAQQRWGAVLVSGSPGYREQCQALGQELGIKVIDGGEPAPRIPRSKETTVDQSRPRSASLPAKQPESTLAPDVTVAGEPAKHGVERARQNDSAIEGTTVGSELSQRARTEPAPAKTAPAASPSSASSIGKSESPPRANKGQAVSAARPPDMPFGSPPSRGGWER